MVVHLFLQHFFLPLNFLFTCLDTALCEQPASLAMNVCGLPSLWRVSMIVFWTTVRSAVFPMMVLPSEPNGETILKAQETFAGVLIWLADWHVIFWDSELVDFCLMWAKIITIKATKDLNYFSLSAFNLFNTRVSQFELNYWNKSENLFHDILNYWDAPVHSIFFNDDNHSYTWLYFFLSIVYTMHYIMPVVPQTVTWWLDLF